MSHPPVRIPHHGNQQVEHEEGGDDSKGRVGDPVHEGQVDFVVGGPINDGEEELKGAEECHGVVVEVAQLVGVFRLEDDIKSWQRNNRETFPA